jgi:hypothetical protein
MVRLVGAVPVLICGLLAGCGSNNSDNELLGFVTSGPSVTNWVVKTSTVTRNNATTTTEYTYDVYRRITKSVATTVSGGSTETVTTDYTYDSFGNPVLTIATASPSGVALSTVTSYSYVGGIIYSSVAITSGGPGGTVTVGKTYLYSYLGKTVITTTTAAGATTTDSSSFDIQGNIVSQTITVGSNPPVTTTWTNKYDATLTRLENSKKFNSGGVLLAETDTAFSSTGKVTGFTTTFYDPVTKIKNGSQVGTSTFDKNDNLESATVTTTSPDGTTITETMSETWVLL